MKNSLKFWIKNDYPLILFLVIFYTVFDFINFSKYFLESLWTPGLTNPLDFHFLVNFYLLDWIVVLIYMIIIAYVTGSLIKQNIKWVSIAFIHLILSFLLGFAVRFLGDGINMILGKFEPQNFSLLQSIKMTVAVMDYNFLIYFSMLFTIYSYYYMKEFRKNEKRKIHLEKQTAISRMKMLHAQLQPHFLFNSLNCISGLISVDQKRAQKTLFDLSHFFRQILKENKSQIVPVRKELEILTYYTNILRVRFAEQLTIIINIEENILNELIPSMILQPLVENSVNHGFSNDHPTLEIKIEIGKKLNQIFIVVENDGERLKSDLRNKEKGIGISNIKERLNLLYDNNYYFKIKNKLNAQGVINIIRLPLTKSKD